MEMVYLINHHSDLTLLEIPNTRKITSNIYYRYSSPLFIPPAFKPPGTSGPGGNLVGPGSSIFHPRGDLYPDEIDPATGGGIPYL